MMSSTFTTRISIGIALLCALLLGIIIAAATQLYTQYTNVMSARRASEIALTHRQDIYLESVDTETGKVTAHVVTYPIFGTRQFTFYVDETTDIRHQSPRLENNIIIGFTDSKVLTRNELSANTKALVKLGIRSDNTFVATHILVYAP